MEIPFPLYCHYFNGLLHRLGRGGYPSEISISPSIATTTPTGAEDVVFQSLPCYHLFQDGKVMPCVIATRSLPLPTTCLLKEIRDRISDFWKKGGKKVGHLSMKCLQTIPNSSIPDTTQGRHSSKCCLSKRESKKPLAVCTFPCQAAVVQCSGQAVRTWLCQLQVSRGPGQGPCRPLGRWGTGGPAHCIIRAFSSPAASGQGRGFHH